jgi:protein SCO1/2
LSGFAGRATWIAVAALVLACAGAIAARIALPTGARAPDFTLTDQNGVPYTLSAHRGHAIAVFFGYAHCPDVCPTTLSALARAKRKLGTDGAAFDVVLITVDPKRDDPPTLKRYVHLFDPSFVGLTGSEAQLDPVYNAYRVYHEIGSGKGSANGYVVAHSSAVQFISPDGRLRGTGDWSDSPDELATLMRQARS